MIIINFFHITSFIPNQRNTCIEIVWQKHNKRWKVFISKIARATTSPFSLFINQFDIETFPTQLIICSVNRSTYRYCADWCKVTRQNRQGLFRFHQLTAVALITRSSAVAVIADRTACKFAVRTPLHMHWSRHSAVSAHVSAGAANGTVPIRGRTNAVKCVLGLTCASFFVLRFMAKRCIVEQKCQKGQIGTLMLGARWYNF